MHLVGFIIRIYHDARSPDHQLLFSYMPFPDNGQRNCPKHVEFYLKNKFEELVHLVGFIIRIYHDARSPDHKLLFSYMPLCCAQRK